MAYRPPAIYGAHQMNKKKIKVHNANRDRVEEGLLIVPPGEEQRVVRPLNGRKFTLEEMQKHVGGFIQEVATAEPCTKMYVDEDGKSKDLLLNDVATALLHSKMLPFVATEIVGNALVVKKVFKEN